MAKPLDITIDQGADFILPLTLLSNDQRITLNHDGGATGTWQAVVRGISTPALAINASAATVQNGLAQNTDLTPTPTVTGSTGGPYDVHWGGPMAGTQQPLINGRASFTPQGTITVANIPIDTTGYTGQFRIWASKEAMLVNDAPLLEITESAVTDVGVIEFGGEDGTITVTVEDAVTLALAFPNPGYYNLLIDDGSDHKTRYIEGKVIRN